MKDIMAKNRSMAERIRDVASSPVERPEKAKEVISVDKEKKKVTRPELSKKGSSKNSSKIHLVERLQAYKIDGDTNRITYIISEKSNAILKLLKSETGMPITDIINFLLEDSIQNNRTDIDKIIKEQFNNLKL